MTEENSMITYENLYDILRKEKHNTELQEIDENFYNKILKYIEEKKEILVSQQKKESIFTTIEVQKTRKQLDNIFKIIKELYEKRENKIIHLALMNSKTGQEALDKSTMLEEEEEFYNLLKNHLDNSRNKLLSNLINGKDKKQEQMGEPKHLKTEDGPKKTKRIKALKPIQSFVGTDLETHGPFEIGDEASLPTDIVNLLVAKNKVEEIE